MSTVYENIRLMLIQLVHTQKLIFQHNYCNNYNHALYIYHYKTYSTVYKSCIQLLCKNKTTKGNIPK